MIEVAELNALPINVGLMDDELESLGRRRIDSMQRIFRKDEHWLHYCYITNRSSPKSTKVLFKCRLSKMMTHVAEFTVVSGNGC
jgi:hypothetical protein